MASEAFDLLFILAHAFCNYYLNDHAFFQQSNDASHLSYPIGEDAEYMMFSPSAVNRVTHPLPSPLWLQDLDVELPEDLVSCVIVCSWGLVLETLPSVLKVCI